MLKAQLQEIIANGESSGVEFKRDDLRPEELAKEVVALVNFQGGRILLGVEDDGSISGLRRDDIEEWVMNSISEKVHPRVLPYYEEVKVDDRKVAILTLAQGNDKPYVRRHKGSEEVFIRVGSTSRLAGREQQMRLYEIGGMLHVEELPVARATSDALDLVRLENYLRDIIQDADIPSSDAQWEDRLAILGFLLAPKERCTVAGLVLFGKHPRSYLRQSGIRVFAFDSTDKEYKARLDEVLDAPLVARWDFTNGSKQLLDEGLVEKLMHKITPFISAESDGIDEGLRREKQYFYPLEAIREVLLNALVHRDWTRAVDIEVGIYSDRLEVISPGSLHNSMTVEKMRGGHRHSRNRIIMDVMRDYGYVDSRGMGIRAKVIPKMLAHNGKEPVIEATEDHVKVILHKRVA